MSEHPKSVDEIFEDYCGRRAGLLRALTDGKHLTSLSQFQRHRHEHRSPSAVCVVFKTQGARF